MSNKPVVVYLAHPYSGNPKENVQRVIRIAEQIIHFSQHGRFPYFYAPLIPHLALSVYREEADPSIRAITEAVSTVLVRACDELWLVSEMISAGMRLEIATANTADIPVRNWSQVMRLIPEIVEKV